MANLSNIDLVCRVVRLLCVLISRNMTTDEIVALRRCFLQEAERLKRAKAAHEG